MTMDSLEFELIGNDMQYVKIEIDPQAAEVCEGLLHGGMFNDDNR